MKSYEVLKRLFIIIMVLCLCLPATATSGKKKDKKIKEDVGTTISLVTTGNGDTKEEATKNALRNALEQTYGAFVSSNSQVVNDELVKDEIVSISTGNIISYKELSFVDSYPKQVTVNAVVSITRLQKYAQNKGMSAELAGNTFAMNLKMEELNIKNQNVALDHLLEQTVIMTRNLFDYKIIVGNPQKTTKGVEVPLEIEVVANDNTLAYYDYFHSTLSSLAIEKRIGNAVLHEGIRVDIDQTFFDCEFDKQNRIEYVLRRGEESDNTKVHNTFFYIFNMLGVAVLDFVIVDNLGNISSFEKKVEDHECSNQLTRDFVSTNKLNGGHLHACRDEYKRDLVIIGLLDYECLPVFSWMNAARPHKDEKLYKINSYLKYSVEEIGKISKIEIKPKIHRTKIGLWGL